MTVTSTRSLDVRQPLAGTLVALAKIPDDVPDVDAHLEALARLAADRIPAADYAAVTKRPGDECTVATSGDLAEAVDGATEPDATEHDATGHQAPPAPGGVAATTMSWPGFAGAAERMGLRTASVPLFTGSGAEIATLDLYSRDAAAMTSLTAGVCAAYDPDLPLPGEDGIPALDDGGEELIAGFMEALSVRATIQFALGVIMKGSDLSPGDAYLRLRLHAADRGVSLLDAAAAVVRPE